jgi:hypothetical protein
LVVVAGLWYVGWQWQQQLRQNQPEEQGVTFVAPPKNQYRLGQMFTLEIDVKNVHSPINAVQADLAFDPQFLEVVLVQTHNSFASIFLQNEFNNQEGWVRLSGGVPNPGFTGSRGVFGTVYFKTKSPGVTEVKYLPSSLVLANDGQGSNILQTLPSTPYLILSEVISDQERQQQDEQLRQLQEQAVRYQAEQLAFQTDVYQQVLGSNSLVSSAPPSFEVNRGRGLPNWLIDFLNLLSWKMAL